MKYPGFRAWAVEKQEFIEDVIHDGESWLESEGYETLSLSEIFDGDEFIVEEDTGLKDRNGKNIHIGDVVSEHQGDIVGKIVQNPSGEYRIAWLGIYGGDSALYVHHSRCEVIGNIHENQELLGDLDGHRRHKNIS